MNAQDPKMMRRPEPTDWLMIVIGLLGMFVAGTLSMVWRIQHFGVPKDLPPTSWQDLAMSVGAALIVLGSTYRHLRRKQ